MEPELVWAREDLDLNNNFAWCHGYTVVSTKWLSGMEGVWVLVSPSGDWLDSYPYSVIDPSLPGWRLGP